MTTYNQDASAKLSENRKWNPTWDILMNVNAARSKAKKARLNKEELYRHMVGSARELRRKMKAIEEK